MRFLFCRIGWMEFYRGLSNAKISSGGAYVNETGIGHEAFNFKPYKGHAYGYCRPSASADFYDATINISRLGADDEADFIEKINVIWFAQRPNGNQVVVGWYKNARVYRNFQYPPKGSRRYISGDWLDTGFYVLAKKKEAILLDIDDRSFKVPMGKGWSGQSNTWFCDAGTNSQKRFLNRVAKYITTEANLNFPKPSKSTRSISRSNLEKRKKVELVSMKLTENYFVRKGFTIDYVHKENLGYDLRAKRGSTILLVEVKGLSSGAINVELTPNEYTQMLSNKDDYRICIVTKALTKQNKLHVFRYSKEMRRWIRPDRESLKIQEKTGARLALE